LPQAIFKPNLFMYKYSNTLIPVIFPTFTAYDECSETSAQNSDAGESPKKKEYNGMVDYRVLKPATLPYPSYINPVHALLSHFSKTLSCSVHLGLPNGLSSSEFPTKTLDASLLHA
jgi:hypothetical protein